ncbi:conserved hypothetical protein [Staphylococcus argenteus]|uniref:Uncharacterized protein n=1 Tax=Staphylococcus argenteus TaxID=985002 RepID=A0A7U7JU87_9STAP|nr:conserved hypothetical protein [Staphylococcus argenteus]CRI26873.1 conserved hypothetical protein [Staphylococcus argenteus]
MTTFYRHVIFLCHFKVEPQFIFVALDILKHFIILCATVNYPVCIVINSVHQVFFNL